MAQTQSQTESEPDEQLLNEYLKVLDTDQWSTTRTISRRVRYGIDTTRKHLKEIRVSDKVEFRPGGKGGQFKYRKESPFNEQTGVASGKFVAAHLGDVDESQVQPNGVDLTISEVFRTSGTATFSGLGYEKPDRTRMKVGADGSYHLVPGQYPIVYGEQIKIPDGYVGRVYPRSRLMRSGLHLTSALWDQGYEGQGEGLLQVPKSIEKVEISKGMPIAQMVFIEATEAQEYDGSHQGERL